MQNRNSLIQNKQIQREKKKEEKTNCNLLTSKQNI